MNGILILNKPKGLSSNTACRKVGRILGEKKVGHLGTLDPMAEGVLPVSLGKCTKLFDFYLQKEKEYVADFSFGYETDTLDADGVVIKTASKIPTESEIEKNLSSFLGEQSQMPPKYSAKKVNGKRAYDLARMNQDFELKPKTIKIFEFSLLEKVDECTFRFKIACSSGTYIRSICRDLAESLNTCATMTKLVRTKCAKFCLENAVCFDEIDETKVISLDEIFNDYDKISINENQLNTFLNSSRLDLKLDNGICCLKFNGDIISFGEINNNVFVSKIRFV